MNGAGREPYDYGSAFGPGAPARPGRRGDSGTPDEDGNRHG